MGSLGLGTHQSEVFNDTATTEIYTAGMRESHVHDVQITKEAPNYNIE